METKTTEVSALNLSPNDIKIIRGIALGVPRKQIAADLSMNVKTFEYHYNGTDNPRSLVARLRIPTVTGITQFALNNGIIKPGEQLTSRRNDQLPTKIDINGVEDLKAAVLRGAAMAANGTSDIAQVAAMVQCSDAYIRIIRVQLDAALMSSGKIKLT
jgi:hypothetical protein